MQNIWNLEGQRLLEWLNTDILSRPTLEIPDPYIKFYINTYFSKDGMRAVLLQSDVSWKAVNSEAKEKDSGKCGFDEFLEGMRLQPIYFISRATVSPLEKSRHSFVGDSSEVRQAKGKFRKYLWRSEFKILSDCSRVKKIFESEANVPHVVHRW